MDLREAFETGLGPDEYGALLSEEHRKLHAFHARRAEVDRDAVDAIRDSSVAHVLAITEPWCGDSLAILPVVLELFSRAEREVRIVRRDEHPNLIDRYLTNGGRAIPIVIVLDENYEERIHWGPRPEPAQRIIEGAREAITAGTVSKEEIHKRIRAFYANDRGRTVIREIVEGIATF